MNQLNPIYLLSGSFTSIFGIAFNLWGAWITFKTFNVKLAPYLILLVSTSINLIALSVTFGTLFYLLVSGHQTPITCNLLAASASTAYLTSTVLISLLSILR